MAELRDILAKKLRLRGHEVRTDGAGKINRALTYALTLIDRTTDAAVELHTNASVDVQATGVEVVSLVEHKVISQRIAQGIARALGLRVRGLAGWKPPEETPHRTLAFCTRGGLVVETFFLSNRGDYDVYMARRWLVAEAIAEAVVE